MYSSSNTTTLGVPSHVPSAAIRSSPHVPSMHMKRKQRDEEEEKKEFKSLGIPLIATAATFPSYSSSSFSSSLSCRHIEHAMKKVKLDEEAMAQQQQGSSNGNISCNSMEERMRMIKSDHHVGRIRRNEIHTALAASGAESSVTASSSFSSSLHRKPNKRTRSSILDAISDATSLALATEMSSAHGGDNERKEEPDADDDAMTREQKKQKLRHPHQITQQQCLNQQQQQQDFFYDYDVELGGEEGMEQSRNVTEEAASSSFSSLCDTSVVDCPCARCSNSASTDPSLPPSSSHADPSFRAPLHNSRSTSCLIAENSCLRAMWIEERERRIRVETQLKHLVDSIDDGQEESKHPQEKKGEEHEKNRQDQTIKASKIFNSIDTSIPIQFGTSPSSVSSPITSSSPLSPAQLLLSQSSPRITRSILIESPLQIVSPTIRTSVIRNIQVRGRSSPIIVSEGRLQQLEEEETQREAQVARAITPSTPPFEWYDKRFPADPYFNLFAKQ